MDRISISRKVEHNEEFVEIEVINGVGQPRKIIYEGKMKLDEFARCITNLSFCEIETVNVDKKLD